MKKERENFLVTIWVLGILSVCMAAVLGYQNRIEIAGWFKPKHAAAVAGHGVSRDALQANVKLWIKESFADPQAELKDIGPMFERAGKNLCVACIRAHNGFGGWIFTYRVLDVRSANSFSDNGNMREFLQGVADEYKGDYKPAIEEVYALTKKAGLDADIAKGINYDGKKSRG